MDVQTNGQSKLDRKKNYTEVCTMLDISPTLLSEIKSRKLRYYGHTRRHASICKDLMEDRVEGKRTRGRPKRVWTDNIKSWSGKSMVDCKEEAMSRESRRTISSRLSMR